MHELLQFQKNKNTKIINKKTRVNVPVLHFCIANKLTYNVQKYNVSILTASVFQEYLKNLTLWCTEGEFTSNFPQVPLY